MSETMTLAELRRRLKAGERWKVSDLPEPRPLRDMLRAQERAMRDPRDHDEQDAMLEFRSACGDDD